MNLAIKRKIENEIKSQTERLLDNVENDITIKNLWVDFKETKSNNIINVSSNEILLKIEIKIPIVDFKP